MVKARDSKSLGVSRAGSNPAVVVLFTSSSFLHIFMEMISLFLSPIFFSNLFLDNELVLIIVIYERFGGEIASKLLFVIISLIFLFLIFKQ